MSEYGKKWENILSVRNAINKRAPNIDTSSLVNAKQSIESFKNLLDTYFQLWEQLENNEIR